MSALTLSDIQAAASRILADRGADGMPPATKEDARAVAEFVRSLTSGEPSAWRVDWTCMGEPRSWTYTGSGAREEAERFVERKMAGDPKGKGCCKNIRLTESVTLGWPLLRAVRAAETTEGRA